MITVGIAFGFGGGSVEEVFGEEGTYGFERMPDHGKS
jgi:hypothetical protein